MSEYFIKYCACIDILGTFRVAFDLLYRTVVTYIHIAHFGAEVSSNMQILYTVRLIIWIS